MVRASGVLPAGGAGTLIFDELCTECKRLRGSDPRTGRGKNGASVTVRTETNDFTLSGRIDRIRGDTLLHYRLTRLKPKDFVRIWIEHLVRNLTDQKPALLFGKEAEQIASYEFPPTNQAREVLSELLTVYWRGLKEPLRLFPRSSWTFTDKIFAGKKKESARYLAEKDWKGNENDPGSKGEREDPYIKLAFRNTADGLDEEWERISLRVFGPIFSARKRR